MPMEAPLLTWSHPRNGNCYFWGSGRGAEYGNQKSLTEGPRCRSDGIVSLLYSESGRSKRPTLFLEKSLECCTCPQLARKDFPFLFLMDSWVKPCNGVQGKGSHYPFLLSLGLQIPNFRGCALPARCWMNLWLTIGNIYGGQNGQEPTHLRECYHFPILLLPFPLPTWPAAPHLQDMEVLGKMSTSPPGSITICPYCCLNNLSNCTFDSNPGCTSSTIANSWRFDVLI